MSDDTINLDPTEDLEDYERDVIVPLRPDIIANPERRCRAMSKQTREQCRQPTIPGGTVCVYHGGNAPQVRHAALMHLLEAVDPALTKLVELLKSKDHAVALRAANSILDRVGVGEAGAKVNLNILIAERPDIDAKLEAGLDRNFAEYEKRRERAQLPASSEEVRTA